LPEAEELRLADAQGGHLLHLGLQLRRRLLALSPRSSGSSGRLERAAGAAFTALPADASNFTARLNLPMD
jgi:hypothetical protein